MSFALKPKPKDQADLIFCLSLMTNDAPNDADRKDLKRRRKADPGKVQVAGRLRRETTMNWQWIAASLLMGAADYAAACVRELLNQS
jgi:hypothetical protein